MPSRISEFKPSDQAAVRRLILDGLAERWGVLDESLNPDLNDIAAAYAGITAKGKKAASGRARTLEPGKPKAR